AADARSAAATDAQAGEKGFFEALGDFFFPDDDRITEGAAADARSAAATDAQAGEKGFFEALGDFFFPDDDR
ncbi:hypothetical protein CNY89_30150, partial [Amaricoccus sp. HAR-UPW-R2A-40]